MPLSVLTSMRSEGSRGESRQRTRARLLRFGRRAFARKGLAATHLKDDILVPAGVSIGSFYHQFDDKTDLFLAILREHSETFRAMIRSANTQGDGESPGAVARQSFTTVFDIADANDDLFRIMARERESHDLRVRNYLRANNRQWIESLAADYRRTGFLAEVDQATVLQTAEMVSALTVGTILTYLDYGPSERPRQRARLIEGLVQFALGGVAALVGKPVPSAELGRKKKRKRG